MPLQMIPSFKPLMPKRTINVITKDMPLLLVRLHMSLDILVEQERLAADTAQLRPLAGVVVARVVVPLAFAVVRFAAVVAEECSCAETAAGGGFLFALFVVAGSLLGWWSWEIFGISYVVGSLRPGVHVLCGWDVGMLPAVEISCEGHVVLRWLCVWIVGWTAPSQR